MVTYAAAPGTHALSRQAEGLITSSTSGSLGGSPSVGFGAANAVAEVHAKYCVVKHQPAGLVGQRCYQGELANTRTCLLESEIPPLDWQFRPMM